MLSETQTRVAVMIAFVAVFLGAISYRGGWYGMGPAEVASVVLVIVAASAALVFAVSRVPWLALPSAVVLVGAACVAIVIASPAPRIDVWEMLQAVARGLLHGHNVYTQHWSPKPPHQATIYAYVPGAKWDLVAGVVLAAGAEAVGTLGRKGNRGAPSSSSTTAESRPEGGA